MRIPWNPANLLSLARLLTTLPLVLLILRGSSVSLFLSALLFVAMAVTDTVDGRLARRYGWVSNIGVFLDLTADKVYTSAALISMVAIGMLPSWIAIVIIAREFIVAGLRSFAAAEGTVIPADRWGKHKMLITIVGVVWMLLAGSAGVIPPAQLTLIPEHGVLTILVALLRLGMWVMVAAVGLTIFSGYEYLRKAARLFHA
ncbi:MAG: CDP-alcohol phosphatidyltransferase family protein [Herpetosiphon sp.]